MFDQEDPETLVLLVLVLCLLPLWTYCVMKYWHKRRILETKSTNYISDMWPRTQTCMSWYYKTKRCVCYWLCLKLVYLKVECVESKIIYWQKCNLLFRTLSSLVCNWKLRLTIVSDYNKPFISTEGVAPPSSLRYYCFSFSSVCPWVPARSIAAVVLFRPGTRHHVDHQNRSSYRSYKMLIIVMEALCLCCSTYSLSNVINSGRRVAACPMNRRLARLTEGYLTATAS